MATKISAEPFLPARLSLKALREAAEHCEGCDLYKRATQAVFGEGPKNANVMLVGEVPGDEEDKQGHPFVGPAGRLLDEALEEAGLAREEVYVTNAVKHFRWEARGKRRLHKKPTTRQIEACKPWLHAELLVVKPEVIVCLGATAAQALLGRDFRITKHRGKFFASEHAAWITATFHPSAVLRAPSPEDREQKRADFVNDLRRVAKRVEAVA
jgi:DNA polymerase